MGSSAAVVSAPCLSIKPLIHSELFYVNFSIQVNFLHIRSRCSLPHPILLFSLVSSKVQLYSVPANSWNANYVRIVKNHTTVWSGCPQFNANLTPPFSYKNVMWTNKIFFLLSFNCELVLFYHNKAVRKSRPISIWNCRPSLWLFYILKKKSK